MAGLLVVDPLLLTAEFGVDRAWAGDEHEVMIPSGFDLDDLAPTLARAEAILTAHAPVTDAMMALAPSLRVISKPGAGVDNIDVGAAAARGVVVTNVPGRAGRAVAEHALFMALPRATRLDARRPRVAGHDRDAARRQDARHRRPRRDRQRTSLARDRPWDVGRRAHTHARSRPGSPTCR